jgi:hypothetical protein
MSVKKSAEARAPTAEQLLLLKIPYTYTVEQQLTVLSVESFDAANDIVEKEKSASKDNEAFYYMLITGSVVPPSRWIRTEDLVFHP